MHVDTAAGRASPAPEAILARVARLAAAHASLAGPDDGGGAPGVP